MEEEQKTAPDNSGENKEITARTPENPASSQGKVAPETATERDEGFRRRQANKDRIEAMEKEPSLQGSFPWLVGLIVLAAGLVASGLIFLLLQHEIHMSEMKHYVADYPAISIRSGALELDPGKDWVYLGKRGRAEIRLGDQRSKGKWNLNGERVTLKVEGNSYPGTLKEETLTLIINQEEHVYRKEGAEEAETAAPETLPTENLPAETQMEYLELPPAELMYDGWAGNYYGWWIRKDPQESWHSGQEFAFWDVCGTLTPTAADRAILELWDSQSQPEDRLCRAEVVFRPGNSAAGRMSPVEGSFLGEPLSKDGWTVDPGDEAVPDMLTIEGSTGSSDYLVFLRPWGMDWDDVNDYPGRFFNDMMPAHYTDWYLLHMEEEMPEYFVGLVFPRVDRG